MDETIDNASSIVDGVREKLMNDWKILQHVFKLVEKEDTFCADPELWREQKIVDFMQPDELKVSDPSPLCRRGLDVPSKQPRQFPISGFNADH